MTDIHIVANLGQALLEREHPAITRWNRLEGRPRTHHFDRALRAEVRDAMWMLSRQWQMGEFIGDDAGSPVLARACLDLKSINRFRSGSADVAALGPDELLEARVERRPVPLRLGNQYLSLDLRMSAGRRWQRLLNRDFPGSDYADQFLSAYGVKVPDPASEADRFICAHMDVWQQVGCAAERAIDGLALLEHVASGGAVTDGISLAQPADAAQLDTLLTQLRSWFEKLINQPSAASDAWLPSQLEYRFGVSAPSGQADAEGGTEIVLNAPEYYHGNLDWYALEYAAEPRLGEADGAEVQSPATDVQTFIPSPVLFDGMPNTRWWAFEDRRTNFGEITPDTTDISKLMLIEFALVYANDWFILPWTFPVGRLAEIRGIAVTTVFNERLWVEPVRPPPDVADWDAWSFFSLSAESVGRSSETSELAVLGVAPNMLEGEALEDVSLIRDEMANMVWAIEHLVPLPTGTARRGHEAGHELRTFLQSLVGPPAVPPPEPAAPLRYKAMTSVPEHWIPFIPVHVEGSSREIQLQRAAMPRFLDDAPPPALPVQPRTPLIRQNLPSLYFIHEEEVPRAGVRVRQGYQRARQSDGSVVIWYGAQKVSGRGEGSSGLAFDQLVPSSPT